MAINISSNWASIGNGLKDSVIIDGVEYTSTTSYTAKAYSGMQVTLTCIDGYSFNPNNEKPPKLSLTKNMCGIWIYGVGVTGYAYSNYSLNDDYTKVTFTISDSDYIKNLNYGISNYASWYPAYYSDYIRATPTTTPKTYTITQNLTGVTTDITATQVEEGKSLTGTFTLTKGYENLNYSIVMGSETITGTNTTFTIDKVTADVIITATATKKVLTISSNLIGCSITEGTIPTSANYGDNIFFTVKPNTGYNKIITAYYTNDAGDKTDITINSSGYVSTLITITENINIYINAQDHYTITENLTNITRFSTNPTTIKQNTTFTLQYETNDNYTIDTLTTNIGKVTINSSKTYANVTGTATSDIVITGSASKTTPTTKTVHITGTIINATCNYTNGETIDTSKQLTITANNGYSFKGSYTYTQNGITYEIDKTSDNKTLYIDLTNYDVYLNDTYTATQDTTSVSAFVNLYSVTSDILSALSKKRIYTSDSTSIDYGTYITALYILPVQLPTNLIGDTSSIILGNYDTKVNATLINNYQFELNLGSIAVPETYQNSYDYINTTCTLYTPFFNSISLKTSDVISHTLSIKYHIDLYTGTAVINIYRDNSTIIYNSNTVITTQIPFIQQQTNNVINTISTQYFTPIDEPFIEVTRNKPYKALNSVFGGTVIEQGNVKDFTGYTVFESCKIETLATEQEKSMIQSQLKAGVYINND